MFTDFTDSEVGNNKSASEQYRFMRWYASKKFSHYSQPDVRGHHEVTVTAFHMVNSILSIADFSYIDTAVAFCTFTF